MYTDLLKKQTKGPCQTKRISNLAAYLEKCIALHERSFKDDFFLFFTKVFHTVLILTVFSFSPLVRNSE